MNDKAVKIEEIFRVFSNLLAQVKKINNLNTSSRKYNTLIYIPLTQKYNIHLLSVNLEFSTFSF